MATTGDILRQGDTDTLVFHSTGADTGGAYLDVEVTYAPMAELRPPLHYHPAQDERFQVLDGELSALVDGRPRTVTAGRELVVSRKQKHSVWNAGSQPVRFRWRTEPALRTEELFETFWGMVQEGRSGRHGSPRPALLQSLLLMWTYRNEWRLTSPPYPIAMPLCAALSIPARLLGHRAHYPNPNTGVQS